MKSPHLRLWTLCVSMSALSFRSFLFSLSLPHTFESALAFAPASTWSAVDVQANTWAHNLKGEVGPVRGCVCVCERGPLADCWTFPSKVHLNSHEVSGSSWVFSDVCNYPVSRQCLVKDKEMHILHRLRSIEEKAWNRPQCLSVGDVVGGWKG